VPGRLKSQASPQAKATADGQRTLPMFREASVGFSTVARKSTDQNAADFSSIGCLA